MASQWAAAGMGSGARRSFTPRKLMLSGKDALPGSVPLIYPDDMNYDPSNNKLTKKPGTQRRKLLVSDIGRELLESIRKPVAVLAICGPYRTGKSYILSRMIDEPKAFELGNTVDACTYGIWVGTTVLECDEFAIVLLDTEGICNVKANATNDAKILVLTVLLSSLFVYNSMKVAQSTDLETMSCFAHLSRSIVVRAGFHKRDASTEFHCHFPDFLWLIRDFTLALPENSEGRQLTPTEYVTQRVLGTAKGSYPPPSTDHVAEAILTFFPSIECQTIPPPSGDPHIMQHIEENEHHLSPRFRDAVEKVIDYVTTNIRIKKGLTSDQIVTGPLLAHAMEEFVHALNDPGAVPNLENTWQAVIMSKLENTVPELVADYEEKMKESAVYRMPLELDGSGQGGLPTLMGIHRSFVEFKVKQLEQKLCLLVPVGTTLGGKSAGDIRTELTAKLVHDIIQYREEELEDGTVKKVVQGGKLRKFVSKNYDKSDSYCRQVIIERYSELKRKLATFDKDYTFQQLKEDLQSLREEYFTHAIGPAKWDVYDHVQETIEFEKEQFRHVKDFQEQAYEAVQRAENARVANEQMQQMLGEIQAQGEQDRKLHNDRLKRMKKENEDALNRLHKEREKERREDKKRFDQCMESKLTAVTNAMKRQVENAEEKFQKRIQRIKEDQESGRKSRCILQ